jgi:hypothetical protein
VPVVYLEPEPAACLALGACPEPVTFPEPERVSCPVLEQVSCSAPVVYLSEAYRRL